MVIIKYWKNNSLEVAEGEFWEDIPGWEGFYQISNLLRVKSVARRVLGSGRNGKAWRDKKDFILKQKVSWTGYWAVFLSKSYMGKQKYYEMLVHILYSKCSFLPNPGKKEMH